jgi:hypothetical protein
MIAMVQDPSEWDHEAWTKNVNMECMLGEFSDADERLLLLFKVCFFYSLDL